MDIKIQNCNNIVLGNIEIVENRLNIKYGINGTGKTSIAKSIDYKIRENSGEKGLLNKLTPFGEGGLKPHVEGINPVIQKVSIFNEDYVKKFIFTEDELIQNSFEIFIKDDAYIRNEGEIESLLEEIKNTFISDLDLKKFINDLKTFDSSTKTAASSTLKALKNGNKTENIPEHLGRYTDYIKSEKSVIWLGWHAKGEDHLEIKDTCPYCTSSLVGNVDASKDKIKLLGTEFKSKEIENLNKTLELFRGLDKYLDLETNSKIGAMLAKSQGISEEEDGYLKRIKSQVETLIWKLENIENINFTKLKKIDLDKIMEELDKMKLNKDVIDYFKSEVSIEKFENINSTIERLKEKASILKGKIKIQNIKIATTVKDYQKEINDFLTIAGYKYSIEFEEKDEIYKIKLKHIDGINNLMNAESHLSYGERNAFSLILFMYKVLKEDVDLIILDDPISSFDKNKKYAILEKLFTGSNSFNNKTVILLTHDFDSIIDTTYNIRLRSAIQPITHFITNNSGVLNEKIVRKEDIKSCIQISKEQIINPSVDNLIKLIYLRRLKEIEGNIGLSYNLISSVLHKRDIPTKEDSTGTVDMTLNEIDEATEEIKKDIADFDYIKEVERAKETSIMTSLYKTVNNYEKLQIYRIIKEGKRKEPNIIKKFIDETFHIENDFLFQLNPSEYMTVPNYVIDICDKELGIV